MPIGIGKTTAGRAGNVPQVNITGYHREVQKRLFYSRREQALLLEKTVRGGFGNLEMGQVMTEVYVDGTAVRDFIVPYGANGKALLLANATSGQATLTIDGDEAACFAVGDLVNVGDSNSNANYEIDDISITDGVATITVTGTWAEHYTTARDAWIQHRRGGKFYVMDQHVDAGGGDAGVEGALTSVVIANAVLYQDAVIGWDSDVATNMNALTDGVYYVIR